MINIGINQEPTELYKILKFEGLASSGAEAKNFIADGVVKLNQHVETQKRKKVMAGDVLEFDGESYSIVLDVTS